MKSDFRKYRVIDETIPDYTELKETIERQNRIINKLTLQKQLKDKSLNKELDRALKMQLFAGATGLLLFAFYVLEKYTRYRYGL